MTWGASWKHTYPGANSLLNIIIVYSSKWDPWYKISRTNLFPVWTNASFFEIQEGRAKFLYSRKWRCEPTIRAVGGRILNLRATIWRRRLGARQKGGTTSNPVLITLSYPRGYPHLGPVYTTLEKVTGWGRASLHYGEEGYRSPSVKNACPRHSYMRQMVNLRQWFLNTSSSIVI